MAAINQDAVDRFVEVCAVDETRARQYISHCDGELETAIQLFFQTGGTLENSHEGQNNADNEEMELRRRINNQAGPSHRNNMPVPVVRPAQRPGGGAGGWIDWVLALVALPIRFTLTTLYDVLAFVGEIVMGQARRPAVTDPRGDVARFRADYAEHYARGAARSITFFDGSYNDALKEGKQSLRMLLIYLHAPNNKDTVAFVRDTLHSAELEDVISRNNLLVWGVSVDSPEGKAVVTSIRPFEYPFLGLVCLNKSNKMILCLRLTGMNTPETVATNLQLTIDDHVAQLNILRMQKAQREEDSRIRQEQEAAYKESVEKDRTRMQERRRLESIKAEAEEKEKAEQRAADERVQVVKDCMERQRALRATAAKVEGAGTVSVQIRYPSGGKHEKRFQISDSLEMLFLGAMEHEDCPHFYRMFTSYPRKEIQCTPEWYFKLRNEQCIAEGNEVPTTSHEAPGTFETAGIVRNAVVMVQDCLS